MRLRSSPCVFIRSQALDVVCGQSCQSADVGVGHRCGAKRPTGEFRLRFHPTFFPAFFPAVKAGAFEGGGVVAAFFFAGFDDYAGGLVGAEFHQAGVRLFQNGRGFDSHFIILLEAGRQKTHPSPEFHFRLLNHPDLAESKRSRVAQRPRAGFGK